MLVFEVCCFCWFVLLDFILGDGIVVYLRDAVWICSLLDFAIFVTDGVYCRVNCLFVAVCLMYFEVAVVLFDCGIVLGCILVYLFVC